jgi:hypothetical protein
MITIEDISIRKVKTSQGNTEATATLILSAKSIWTWESSIFVEDYLEEILKKDILHKIYDEKDFEINKLKREIKSLQDFKEIYESSQSNKE